MTTPRVQATTYTVSLFPEDDINTQTFAITVEYRGRGLWAAARFRRCLGTDGEWDWEPIPSERDDEWLSTHRFTQDEAIRLAVEAAPHVVVNGHTAAEVAARLAATGTAR